MVISGKGRLSYLDGTTTKPSTDDPLYQIWDAQNSMVMTWLIHSMEDKINETSILSNYKGNLGRCDSGILRFRKLFSSN